MKVGWAAELRASGKRNWGISFPWPKGSMHVHVHSCLLSTDYDCARHMQNNCSDSQNWLTVLLEHKVHRQWD